MSGVVNRNTVTVISSSFIYNIYSFLYFLLLYCSPFLMCSVKHLFVCLFRFSLFSVSSRIFVIHLFNFMLISLIPSLSKSLPSDTHCSFFLLHIYIEISIHSVILTFHSLSGAHVTYVVMINALASLKVMYFYNFNGYKRELEPLFT